MSDIDIDNIFTHLATKGYRCTLARPLSSGKEARLFLVSCNEELCALKVYKNYENRSFQNNQEYLQGRYVRRHSENRAMQKRTKFGKNLMHKLWVKREFYLMKKLYDAGADIPEPIEMTQDSILMQFIGDGEAAAPLLKDVVVPPALVDVVYKQILKNIDIFYECGIVHGDLSPFNILYWQEKTWIIDFPQAIDIRNNPNVDDLLKRDRDRISEWYKINA